MPTENQIIRLDSINEFMKFLSDIDYHSDSSCFFLSKKSLKGTINNYSRFEFQNDKLFYIDKYTENRIYPYESSKHRGFSSGGTLWALVNDFRRFIIAGKSSDAQDSYGGLYCTHWGGKWNLENKDLAIEQAKTFGYLRQDAITFTNFCLLQKGSGDDFYIKHYLEEIDSLLEINKLTTTHS